ncbi:MAG TPA: DUF885 domain-containing protein [Xanthomonadales bacterium]
MKKSILIVLLLLFFTSSGFCEYQDEIEALTARIQALAGNDTGMSDSQRFEEIVAMTYDYTMLSYPEFATFLGDPRGQDRWSDQSEAMTLQRQKDTLALVAALENVNRDALSASEQVNYDLLYNSQVLEVEGQQFPGDMMPVNQMGGVQQDIAQMMAISRPKNAKDYANMIARLNKTPEVVEQTIAWMRKGMAAGVTPPAVTLRDVPQQIRNQLVDEADQSPMLGAFKQFPASVDSLQQATLKKQAETAYSENVAPAFEKLLVFMENEYLPAARESIAMRDLPNGEAWYAYNVKRSTTTDLTPEQIHQIGLDEVKRIRGEMEEIIRFSGFEGSFEAFLVFLRTDPQFYHQTREDLLREYRDIAKRADPELMKLFGKLPRTPYGVVPVPAYAEKSQTTAYYQPGSVKAGRPGNFYANTYALDTRPRWEMEALTLHEAVPGHHLQIALQDELEDVPWFRRVGSYTAFIEGWGLYSESLGEDMGFYQDPYSKFGQLTYEMWRAIRLVVDTGMHQLGWSRQQAIDYFMANAGKQEHDVVVEVDRYIVWPGQALAYKIGELKIKELRAFATDVLGEAFDIREFHDEVLGRGAVPLSVLEANIRAWVATKKAE